MPGRRREWLAVSGTAERIKLTAEEIELIVDAERRDLTLSRQRIEIRSAVTTAVAAVSGTAGSRKITITVQLENAPSHVTTDMSWFGVALQRVLAEAIDCSPTPGAVKVGWEDGATGSGWLRVAKLRPGSHFGAAARSRDAVRHAARSTIGKGCSYRPWVNHFRHAHADAGRRTGHSGHGRGCRLPDAPCDRIGL